MAHNGQLFESHAAAATAGVKLHRGWAHVNWLVAGWGCCWLSQAKNLNAFGYPWLYMSNYINTCLNHLESSFNFVLSNLGRFFPPSPAKDSFPRKSNMCFRSSASAFEFCLTRTTPEVSWHFGRLVKFEEMRDLSTPLHFYED